MWTASADCVYSMYVFHSCHLMQLTNSVDYGFCVDEMLGSVWTRDHVAHRSVNLPRTAVKKLSPAVYGKRWASDTWMHQTSPSR